VGKTEVIAAVRGKSLRLGFHLAIDTALLIFAYLVVFTKIYLVAKYFGLISAPSFLACVPWG